MTLVAGVLCHRAEADIAVLPLILSGLPIERGVLQLALVLLHFLTCLLPQQCVRGDVWHLTILLP